MSSWLPRRERTRGLPACRDQDSGSYVRLDQGIDVRCRSARLSPSKSQFQAGVSALDPAGCCRICHLHTPQSPDNKGSLHPRSCASPGAAGAESSPCEFNELNARPASPHQELALAQESNGAQYGQAAEPTKKLVGQCLPGITLAAPVNGIRQSVSSSNGPLPPEHKLFWTPVPPVGFALVPWD